jgi:hypothetical protein
VPVVALGVGEHVERLLVTAFGDEHGELRRAPVPAAVRVLPE